jgi:hypothetical protein
MINKQYNYDDNFFRMVGVALTKTLQNSISWINHFDDKKIRVVVPFYMSIAGDERFLLDAFVDDIPDKRVELNTDIIPRGIVSFMSMNSDTSQFANPNQYLSRKKEINGKLKTLIQKTKAVPVSLTYNIDIVLKTEIDVLKASEKLLNTLFNYMFFNIDYFGIKIDAVFSLPDDKEIEIQREITSDTDNKKHIRFSLKVDTYYPIFLSENSKKIIDIDDYTVCDNDDEIDWTKIDKTKPSEMSDTEINSAKRVYWKNNIIMSESDPTKNNTESYIVGENRESI